MDFYSVYPKVHTRKEVYDEIYSTAFIMEMHIYFSLIDLKYLAHISIVYLSSLS